jgi:hypothetical protein
MAIQADYTRVTRQVQRHIDAAENALIQINNVLMLMIIKMLTGSFFDFRAQTSDHFNDNQLLCLTSSAFTGSSHQKGLQNDDGYINWDEKDIVFGSSVSYQLVSTVNKSR